MELELKGKNLFIAGASQGIGAGIAEGFLKEGANVVLTARTLEKLQKKAAALETTYGPGRISYFAGDMTDTEQLEAAFDHGEKELGNMDIAISNVGLDNTPPGIHITDEQFEGGVTQNFYSAFRLARTALKRFESRGTGNLIFISSLSSLTAFGTALNYGTSKAAVNHLTKELARQYGKMNIRINCICPGNIDFPGSGWDERIAQKPDLWNAWFKREVPLRRMGTPEEIADACLWLSSPRASFVTGAVIPIDGGQSRK